MLDSLWSSQQNHASPTYINTLCFRKSKHDRVLAYVLLGERARATCIYSLDPTGRPVWLVFLSAHLPRFALLYRPQTSLIYLQGCGLERKESLPLRRDVKCPGFGTSRTHCWPSPSLGFLLLP